MYFYFILLVPYYEESQRFLEKDYQELFPREWDEYFIVNRRNVRQAVEAFWRRQEEEAP